MVRGIVWIYVVVYFEEYILFEIIIMYYYFRFFINCVMFLWRININKLDMNNKMIIYKMCYCKI